MSGGSRSVVIKALVANAGIAVAKFAAAGVSRSASMLSEAVHSLADSGNQLFLLIGMRRSTREEDEDLRRLPSSTSRTSPAPPARPATSAPATRPPSEPRD